MKSQDVTDPVRAPVLALDLGSKRVGVAVSDALSISISRLDAIQRTNWKQLLRDVEDLVRRFDAKTLVIGLPLKLNGSLGDAALATRKTAQKFARSLPLLVYLQDERLSSTEAEANLRGATAEAAAADDEESAAEKRDPEVTLRNQPPVVETSIDEPLYTMADTQATLRLFKAVGYDRETAIAPGIHATFLDAGHILGSAIIRVRVSDGDKAPEKIIVFSGDLGRRDTPIIRDPTTVSDADYLLVESTYGGREHEPQAEAVRILAETVQLVAKANGVLLVPSFAIGRTQEVVWQLDRLLDQKKIPSLPLYLDSPMASKATEIYRRHGEYYDQPMRELLAKHEDPLDYPKQQVTNDIESSRAISKAPRPYMIVASNGMLTGGRVVNHLRELIDDPTATLLFVGYQGQGTLGSQLQAGVKTVRIDGEMRDVRCQIRSISGFSAHADESELLDWIRAFKKPRLRRVFIVHGDPDAQAAIEPKIRALGFDTHVPKWHERVTLE